MDRESVPTQSRGREGPVDVRASGGRQRAFREGTELLSAPRIYALPPTGVGDTRVDTKRPQDLLERVAGLGFDWLLWQTAAPGTEHRAEPKAPPDADRLGALCAAARGRGIAVMADLTIPPALLARYRDATDPRPDARVERLRRRLAADPAFRRDLVGALRGAVSWYAGLGVSGVRCRHAHWLPSTVWREIMVVEGDRPVLFLADTLGAALPETLALAEAGFHHVFNSVCWWNGRDPWFTEQVALLRRVAATVGFPEPPDGMVAAGGAPPVAADDLARRLRSRYLLAATLSAGVLMPMGYEVGHRASPLRSGGHAGSVAAIDISAEIAAINALKAETPLFGTDGAVERLTGEFASVPILLRRDAAGRSAAALVAEVGGVRSRPRGLERIVFAAGGALARFEDRTPARADDLDVLDPAAELRPFDARVLIADGAAERRSNPPAERRSEQHLKRLAEERIAIEAVAPEVDGGRFRAKRVIGDELVVEADIFCDGHEVLGAALHTRQPGARAWRQVPMRPTENDRWQGRCPLPTPGIVAYTIAAWRDLFATWRTDTAKKRAAGQSLGLEIAEGRALVERGREDASAKGRQALDRIAARLEGCGDDADQILDVLLGDDVAAVMAEHGPRANVTELGRTLEVFVDRPAAAYGAWYELMPRSQSGDPQRHGTFDDVIARLGYVRDLGFDVLYFPPIHPIGRTNRKGRNNTLTPVPDDPGSPYAIGAEEGGHDALHPELGSFEDFARLIAAARNEGLEIALDFAIQCSPDHPWIREHPEWFDWRPDGTIKFAENPPKKYEDIVNVHFYRGALPGLWIALRDVVLFWVDKGVRIFRVDNPHTKPLPFWEWLIAEVQARDPSVIFLAEAFTRPKMMQRLAKVGFNQSYSYFTWRNTKAELATYLTELTRGPSADYMRPNFFVNTPDINPHYLQTSGRAGFQVRLVLAATLSPVYGIYNGFELCEAAAIPGKEEYLDSEKYEIRAWDWDRPGNIRDDVAAINRIRRENPALWRFTNLTFLNAWNDAILAYYKITPEKDDCVVVAVNLDPFSAQGTDFEIPLWELGLPDHAAVDAVDLVTGHRFTWFGKVQSLLLDPADRPYAVWRLVPPQT